MAEQVLWMIAAAPGTVEDRANVLQLVSRELSCGGSALAGQLVKAIARAEAAIIVRNGPHVPAQALSVTPAILEDWVAWVAEDTSAGALDEGADEGDVLLHVMGAATDVRDIRLASQLADRLPDELPLTPAACKALLDLAAQRGGATGSRFVSRVWANEGAVRSLDPEAYTMLLRAELASAGSERGSSLAAAAAAAVEHRERAPLQVARQIVEAVQASGSSQPDATFGIVLTQALAERGEFTIKFGSAVDAVLKIVKKARLAVDSDLARCLMAASLREPERLDTRALRKRFAVVQNKLRLSGWVPKSDVIWQELLSAVSARGSRGIPAKGDRAGATSKILDDMQACGIQPSLELYTLAVNLCASSSDDKRRRLWTTTELAQLRFAVARHITGADPSGQRGGKEKLSLQMQNAKKMARAQFQQQWSAVAHDVGTGRSAWQCHRRWGMLLQSPEGSANPSQQLTAKTDKQAQGGDKQRFRGLKWAVNMLGRMNRDGLQPPTALCNQVLRQCATAYVPWLALSLYEQMQNWGVEPDANSMHYAVQACARVHPRGGFTGTAAKLVLAAPHLAQDETWLVLLSSTLTSHHPRAWEATVALVDRHSELRAQTSMPRLQQLIALIERSRDA